MDDLDIDTEQKNLVGGIDRAVINIGLVCLLIFPTYLFLIFRPKAFVPLLRGEAKDGRDGLKLGPGVTFVLTVLLLIAIGYLFREATSSDLSPDDTSGFRQALAEGNIWRAIIRALPLYFCAVGIGLLIQLTHILFRQKTDLRQAIGIGLYALSVLLIMVIPVGLSSNSFEAEDPAATTTMGIFAIGIAAIIPWQIYSFSKHGFGNKTWAAAGVAIASFILFLVAISAVGFAASSLRN